MNPRDLILGQTDRDLRGGHTTIIPETLGAAAIRVVTVVKL
jgi:hypothetical protein